MFTSIIVYPTISECMRKPLGVELERYKNELTKRVDAISKCKERSVYMGAFNKPLATILKSNQNLFHSN